MNLALCCPPLFSRLWSRLPVELIQEILLFLASISTRQACQLRFISKDVNRLIVPHLFRDVVFNTTERITRFSSSLAPRRPVLIPALKKKFISMPPNLSDYHVESLTLVVNKRLPSIELALASMAPMFNRVRKLAITGEQLLANAHWLRRYPLRPRFMMIIHHGRPPLLNFHEPIFDQVTHLYTSSLFGHHNRSSVLDLPNLTHLCVTARRGVPQSTINEITAFLWRLLAVSPTLKSLVFCLNTGPAPDPDWSVSLKRFVDDKRFVLIPYHPLPRMQWRNIILGRMSIWDKAENWRTLDSRPDWRETPKKKEMVVEAIHNEQSAFQQRVRCPEGEWEADLVERDGYEPPDMDPDQRGGFLGVIRRVVCVSLSSLKGFIDPFCFWWC
ncbi:hypothetical protein BDQ17DRAFT_634647 [Cyathus striatus]|nr:hypothetical protein BDQ17DRAFT_634647 [Cyathus striatus]